MPQESLSIKLSKNVLADILRGSFLVEILLWRQVIGWRWRLPFGLSEETPRKWKHTNKQLQTPSKAKMYLLSRFKLICLEWIGILTVIWKIFGGFWTKLSCNMKVKSSERGTFQMLFVEVKLYPKFYLFIHIYLYLLNILCLFPFT